MYGRRTLLSIWTISMEKGQFIARRFEVHPGVKEPVPTADVLRSGTLAPLRNHFMAHGLVCMPRSPGDLQHIIESWL